MFARKSVASVEIGQQHRDLPFSYTLPPLLSCHPPCALLSSGRNRGQRMRQHHAAYGRRYAEGTISEWKLMVPAGM